MKLHNDFKIDLSRDKSCIEGGVNHREVEWLDVDRLVIGYRCLDCDYAVLVKRRRRRVKSKIVL